MKHVVSLRRRMLLAALSAYSLLALCAAPSVAQQGPGVTDKEIKIGAFIPLTGPVAAYGVPMRAGFQSYIDMINDRGGVNGRKITWIVEDNAYNPQRSVAAARKLVTRDEILAFVHANGTAQSMAVFPFVLDEAKVPFLFPYGGLKEWHAPPRENLYGMQLEADLNIRLAGRWAAKDGMKNIIVVHSATAAFEAFAKEAIPGIKSANPNASIEFYGTKFDTQDYAPIALDIAAKKPDALIIVLAQGDMIKLAKELAQQKVKVPLYSWGSSVSNSTIEVGGSALEGMKALSWVLPPETNSPAIKEYRDALAKYAPAEKPDYISLMSFGVGKVFVEALRRIKGPINRQSLVAAVESIKNFETGIFAPVNFGPDKHMGVSAMQRVQISGGKWVLLPGAPVGLDLTW